jgi:hypothetical protein
MNFYDDELENDDDNQPQDGYVYRGPERGGCLTIFLVVGFVGYLLSIAASLYIQFQINTGNISEYLLDAQLGLVQLLLWILAIIGIGGMVCIWGLWNWKRWGYYGVIAIFVAGAVINFLSGMVLAQQVLISIFSVGILIYLMRDKMIYLE